MANSSASKGAGAPYICYGKPAFASLWPYEKGERVFAFIP